MLTSLDFEKLEQAGRGHGLFHIHHLNGGLLAHNFEKGFFEAGSAWHWAPKDTASKGKISSSNHTCTRSFRRLFLDERLLAVLFCSACEYFLQVTSATYNAVT
jgi:hypothetical protein